MIFILEKSLDGTRRVFFGPALYSERRTSGVAVILFAGHVSRLIRCNRLFVLLWRFTGRFFRGMLWGCSSLRGMAAAAGHRGTLTTHPTFSARSPVAGSSNTPSVPCQPRPD